MRVVNAMFGMGLGGIEQALVDTSEALALVGHEVMALVQPRAAIAVALQAKNIPFVPISNFGDWDPFAVLRLRRLFLAFKPERAIAHGNRALTLLRKSAGQTPLLAPLHNYKIRCRLADIVLAPTRDLMRYALAQHVPESHIREVPNFVRVPEVMPVRQRQSPPVIGAMGRFVAKKGFDVFIEALALLAARGVAFRAELAGGGAEEAALKALAARRGLADRLVFSGWVADKNAFFGRIDLFCLPSLHEPFGIVLLEAMAEGLPVVATQSEGPSEIIRGGRDGMLVPPGNASALAEALGGLLGDRARAAALGEQGWERVRQTYDLPVVARKLDLALRSDSPV